MTLFQVPKQSLDTKPEAAGAAGSGMPRGGRWRLRRWTRRGLVALAVAVCLWVAGEVALLWVPLPAALFQPPPTGVELLDREGRTLRALQSADGAYARPARPDEIPQSLVDATLAAEDRRFYTHRGVDPWAIARAAWDGLRHRRVVSGASTITQQLIKRTEPRHRTWRTKLVEAVQAMRLEQVWDKRRILTEYLNRVEYGNLAVGCAEAARIHFDKPLRDLSPAECALLAGLPQAPTRLNPRQHPERARRRQQWILGRMEANGLISAEEARRARAEPLRLASSGRVFQAPHFVDHFLTTLPGGGWGGAAPGRRVRTTLDLELNRLVEGVLSRQLGRLRSRGAQDGAVVVIDNATGGVLVLVGSADYFDPRDGQVNGAWAPRSAGSTLKPFTYLLALEHGWTPASVLADVPVEFPTETGLYRPENYDRRFHGPVRLRPALANSYNVPAVRLLERVGGAAALQGRLRDFGLTTLTRSPEHYGLGLTIGNAEVRLLELANAYAALARLGQAAPVRLRLGAPAASAAPPRRVAESGAAWLIADILADPRARAEAFGLGSDLRLPFPAAVKTGTSSGFRDNWAVGFTPEFTVGVWVGNFDGAPMHGVSGVSGAAPVWREVMEALKARRGVTWYERPLGIEAVEVHPVTGRQVPPGTPGSVHEWCLAGAGPEWAGPDHVDVRGRIRLPFEYAAWLAGPDSWLAGQAVADAPTGDPEARASGLRLLSPLPGTVFFIDPDLPESGRWIPLRAESAVGDSGGGGSGAVRWESDTLECREGPAGPVAVMVPGRHRLTVTRPGTSRRLETWVEIKRL